MNIEVIKAKSKLPLDFISDLYGNFTERNADKILEGMTDKRYTTFRINNIKSNSNEVEDALRNNKIEFEKVEWYDNAYVIKNCNESKIQQLDIFRDGKIYLQSLSSMVPPLVLNPKEGNTVLDMTAAPRK